MRGLLQILAKGSVYVSGFAQAALVASVLNTTDFGELSFFQGLTEFALVVGTLGSGLLITRAKANTPSARISTFRTLALGVPCGLAIMLVLGRSGVNRLDQLVGAVLALTLVAQSFNQLMLHQFRGAGHVIVFTAEPAVRSVGVVAILLARMAAGPPSVADVLLIYALGHLASALYLRHRSRKEWGQVIAGPAISEQLRTLPVSAAGFFAKKADVLLFGLVEAASTVANLKICFLFAEVPYQMAQLSVIRESKSLATAAAGPLRDWSAAVQVIMRESLLIAGAFALLLLGFYHFGAQLLAPKFDLSQFFLGLLIYFLLRSASGVLEVCLIFTSEYGRGFRAAVLCGLAKVAMFGAATQGLVSFHSGYAILGAAELAVYAYYYSSARAGLGRP